ncbi:NERD domain-containing protein [Staphylococcus pseudintermedius]|uniref:NERD domain-containing protein n=1 Tax=Staphylococcus pseudintermedius TaxID=283734 RepID=UPI0028861A29|nr:NERD domain-containing protein [Staphylococcus pseudintermedius]MDT0815047.1 NERD domain-containing protein [Staphylococcus pseudintermedius]MDT0881927.1 NERD domain-containing protein [Staphylococcus pseudintermedius]MDT0918757.1 NERD domain-containing protein [Staphylococcus pseudintermedius]MDT0947262.1 NERD domain-containing protein [Staphylococcus pseudintermedius]MDT0955753.1 NERD domain-containing protein [Staphylococcus pseudintermedius]
MTQFGLMEIGLIAAIVVAALFFILFLVALKSKKKAKETYANQYQTKQEKLTHEHQEELEKVRIDKKKAETRHKEEYETMVSSKNREIDALKLFSKNHSEYVTDMRLLTIRERLVKEKRIRPEDMHIMANIFLPTNDLEDITRVSHLVLTRTGLYVIDSELLKGHVYQGISQQQFSDNPMMEQVFKTLDLSPKTPQTVVLDQSDASHNALSIVDYTDRLAHVEALAVKLQHELDLKYTPTPILYFNPRHEDDVTILNYASQGVTKVLVGPEQLNEFFNRFVFHGRIQYDVNDLQNIMDEIESFN